MIDIQINIENADILALMNIQKYDEAINVINIGYSNKIEFDKLMHLYLLHGYCYYKMKQYPLAINTLNKILKHRYNQSMEHHVLSQAFQPLAETHMEHSRGKNKAKNRSTFIAISSCFDLLCYREETLEIMDRFLELVGKK